MQSFESQILSQKDIFHLIELSIGERLNTINDNELIIVNLINLKKLEVLKMRSTFKSMINAINFVRNIHNMELERLKFLYLPIYEISLKSQIMLQTICGDDFQIILTNPGLKDVND